MAQYFKSPIPNAPIPLGAVRSTRFLCGIGCRSKEAPENAVLGGGLAMARTRGVVSAVAANVA
jgi:hypothetical protein